MTTRVHKVEPGESLYSIAHQYGIACWQSIYEHPDNADLRRRRPNPHVLHPGDEVRVPEQCPGGAPVPLDRRTVVVRRRRGHQRVRLVVTDGAGAPLRNQPWRLEKGGDPLEGQTDEQGLVTLEVPSDARELTLRVGEHTLELAVGELNPLEADAPDQGVSGAQARLNNLGYDPGPADGLLGPRTEDALRDFQADHGLEVTGQLDDATRQALLRRHGS